MQIDRDLILRLENLAKLELSEEERERLRLDLTNILQMVEKLKELDTSNIEPLTYISDAANMLREDQIKAQVTNEHALSNAPEKSEPYFKVPKVMQ
ncbi:MAG: Asp-tRNA(Asn)/Glu-tRNA(Gln) amidotransferase subunit GatC [Saprospiraceae bacterium]|nr:Asp-tRNA(Asn)/Glu-tRNA(Gln) amidotransferase subunit GatC [Saprospiraceae bacterium]MCF8248466.1 Asp-tRNA(Asn)/Glu-tRNA(Gln) amidotransferase subunit GatC [Saprospiraceae bacterium]MCF8281798.1 Asp-tRNA(Asn)/Glu-tRNA(Gln) amidotransferase subunit GatC [Bacteroidales bacterium]MCF8310200.1 Asp-tRNA(Asn)/Glu-tRNA(Gln) amidotransferase subunit GatC [Saprospiraceae bacterium]MCF8439361.1 Asp-tRNA(Asn)/Glu-tRNA(Gln) amidotransferase subunit GatC [Saprospiraceae bacterium]